MKNFKDLIQSYFKNHKGISKLIYLIGALSSACYTYFARISNNEEMTINLLGYQLGFLTLAFVIVWDMSKFVLYVKYDETKKMKYLVVWFFVMIFSVMFTTGAMLQKDVKEINKTANSQIIFENTMANRQSIIDQIETKTSTLKTLENELAANSKHVSEQNKTNLEKFNTLNGIIENLKQEKLSKELMRNKTKYQTNKDALQNDIDVIQGQIDANISARDNLYVQDNSKGLESKIEGLNSEINKLNSELREIKVNENLPMIKSENTMVPLYERFTKNVESFSLIFNVIIALLYELIICYFYDISQGRSGNIIKQIMGNIKTPIINTNNSKPIMSMSKENNIKNKALQVGACELQNEYIPDEIPRKNPIGFQAPNNISPKTTYKLPKNLKKKIAPKICESITNKEIIDDFNFGPKKYKIQKNILPKTAKFTNEELTKYFNYMIQNPKRDNISLGYKKISEAIGLVGDKGRKIKGYLETIGVIECREKTTYILKNKLEV